jgi:hypothetical protein
MATEATDKAAPGRGRRSRREILGGAAGRGGVRIVRSVVLRTSAALAVALTVGAVLVATGSSATANQGDPILAGIGFQHESGTTQLIQDGNVSGLDVTANTGGRAIGGFSSGGQGLYGNGATGVYGTGATGVYGTGSVYGVYGYTDPTSPDTYYGVYGIGPTGVYGAGGAYGLSGIGSIYGVAGIGSTGSQGGVYGRGDGNGVFGETYNASASGVYGQNNTTGYGVAGRSDSGTGVLADSANGTALLVTGKAQFSRSGKATVKAGNLSAVVQNVALTTDSLVLATLQQFEGGVYVAAVLVNVASSRFTIRLNQAPTGNLKVAWFVVN